MSNPPTSLETLMQQALAGDKVAYTDVLRQTTLFLRPFLNKRLRNNSEVDDLLQEILLSIHKSRHTYNNDRPFRPWVFAIAKFRLLDHLRKHYADHLHHAEDLSEAKNIPDDVTKTGFSYESISVEVSQLPERQAVILRLIHREGFTAKEVAAKMGMNESAVKVSAHRAYKTLRNKLTEMDIKHDG